jgi:hypothetical protein
MKNNPLFQVNLLSRVLLGFLFIILSFDTLAKCRLPIPEVDMAIPIIIQGTIVFAENDLESSEHHYVVNVSRQLKGPALASTTLNLSFSFMNKIPRTVIFQQGKEYVNSVSSVM